MDLKKVSFVEFERKRLISLVDRHKEIVQNRGTDSTTIHRKQLVWERITQEYNRHPNVRKRQTKQLKRLWQNSIARSKRQNNQVISEGLLLDSIGDDLEAGESRPNQDSEEDRAILESEFQESSTSSQCFRNPDHNQIDISTNDETEESVEQLLAPIISARLRKVEESIRQQYELHQLQLQREQIQLNGVQDELQRQTLLHAQKMDREREISELRMNLEKDLHMQRMRHEQELHQLKLNEYNKMQAASYQIMYK